MKEPSYFSSVNLPYYIFTTNYTQKSAGIRALHSLCHALNELGSEAYLIGCEEESLSLRTPLLKNSDVLRHIKLGLHPIIVYPEVVSGNPLNMLNVARWLLNWPGHVGGDVTFDESELIFAYSEDYIPEGLDLYTLYIPGVNSDIFNNLNNPFDLERSGSCFYAHKYLADGFKLTDHADGAISLCQDVKLTHEEIAAVLRRSEFLFCYEPSAIITEARLCGCTVIMVSTIFLDKNSQKSIIGPGLSTTDASLQEITEAKKTIHKIAEEHEVHNNYSWEHVKTFISHTQEVFSGRSKNRDSSYEYMDYIFELISNKYAEENEFISRRSGIGDKKWLRNNLLSEGRVAIMAEQMANEWKQQPSFHLVITVDYDELELLSETLTSLQEQLYCAWGLTILSGIAQPDFFIELPENIEWVEISTSINEEINKAVGESGLGWVMQLLPGDKLLPHALLSFSEKVNREGQASLIYSDEIEDESKNSLLFKPDFNLELLRSTSYLGRSVMIRRDAFESIGGYTGLSCVAMSDLAFNVYESWGREAFAHIEDILYVGSPDKSEDGELRDDNELAVRVAHFSRLGVEARISRLEGRNTFHVNYLGVATPLVTIVIANKNSASALWLSVEELLEHTSYSNYELLIVDQMSDVEDMAYIFQDIKEELGERFTLLSYPEANYSAMVNFAVSHAKGEQIVVLANSAMPVNDSWLTNMCSISQQKDVGVVGVRVIDADNRLVHCGGVLGVSDDVRGLFSGHLFDDAGYMGRAQITQEYSFVSSACFMVSKPDFMSVGGLDEQALANSRYCVTDFCLKLRQRRKNNIWMSQAVFRQNMELASHTNGVCDSYKENVDSVLLGRWPAESKKDASYNRHLSLRTAGFEVEVDIPLGWDEKNSGRPRVMAFPFNKGGIGRYRVIDPLEELTHEAMIESVLLPVHDGCDDPFVPSLFEILRSGPDVLLMHLTLGDAHYEFLEWIKAETDIFVIFSIDDLVQSLPKKNSSIRRLHKDIRHRLRRVLSLSDRVIASTQPLADSLSSLCEDVVVVPNCIDLNLWQSGEKEQRSDNGKLRVGWAGGLYHSGDLEIISEVVKETSEEVDWVFMGMCPDDLRSYIHEYHEFSSFDLYPEKLAALNLDLAVAPLEVHPFNEAKSNLRLLEYGALGLPVICTDIYPYRTNNPPVVRVENSKSEWLDAIRKAISQPESLREKGGRLQEWVKCNYILQDSLSRWLIALSGK